MEKANSRDYRSLSRPRERTEWLNAKYTRTRTAIAGVRRWFEVAGGERKRKKRRENFVTPELRAVCSTILPVEKDGKSRKAMIFGHCAALPLSFLAMLLFFSPLSPAYLHLQAPPSLFANFRSSLGAFTGGGRPRDGSKNAAPPLSPRDNIGHADDLFCARLSRIQSMALRAQARVFRLGTTTTTWCI